MTTRERLKKTKLGSFGAAVRSIREEKGMSQGEPEMTARWT